MSFVIFEHRVRRDRIDILFDVGIKCFLIVHWLSTSSRGEEHFDDVCGPTRVQKLETASEDLILSDCERWEVNDFLYYSQGKNPPDITHEQNLHLHSGVRQARSIVPLESMVWNESLKRSSRDW